MTTNDPPHLLDASEQFERAKAFLRRTLRSSWLVLLMILIGASACAIFFEVRSPRYRSETVMMYSEGIRATDPGAGPAATPQATAIRLREMLLSRARLEQMIRRFHLYPKIVKQYGYIDAVEELREHMDFRAPGGDTYTIAFEGASPVQARDVTAALAESLIAEDKTLRRDKARKVRDFLQGARKESDDELKKTELALAEFLAAHPGFALDSMLLMPGAPPTGAAIRAAEAEKPAPQRSARLGAFSRPGVLTPAAPAAAGPAVPADIASERARAEADLHAARADLADKLARYTPQHPDALAAAARVDRADARVRSAQSAINSAIAAQPAPRSSPPTEAKPQQPPPRRMMRPPPAPKKEAAPQDLVALETDWSKLVRGVNEARTRHEQLEANLFKAEIAASSESGGQAVQVAVVDPAYLPTREVPPGRLTLIGIFMVLSLVLGAGLAMLKAVLDDRIYGKKELDGVGPLLVAVPKG